MKQGKGKMKHEIEQLIKLCEWKLEALPKGYFIEFFEKEFLPKLKELVKQI